MGDVSTVEPVIALANTPSLDQIRRRSSVVTGRSAGILMHPSRWRDCRPQAGGRVLGEASAAQRPQQRVECRREENAKGCDADHVREDGDAHRMTDLRSRACQTHRGTAPVTVAYARFLRCEGGFQPNTTSALHRTSVSSEIRKSAKADTFAGRARAVGVTKYNPPPGRLQSDSSGSSCLFEKYCVATNSGNSVIASPSSTVGNNASILVPLS